jgi:hypothetical protein
MNSAIIFSRIQRTAWIGWIFLLAGVCVSTVNLYANCVSADSVAPPPMSVSGTGVIKIDDNTYAVLQGAGDIVISSSASAWNPPCLDENELSLPAIEEPETCTCVQAGPPSRHENPAYGPAVATSDGIVVPSGISGVQMSNNNTELTWTISGSTNTGEYVFSESAVVRQNYRPCPEESGWYGGVTAGYKEAQVGEVEVKVIVFKVMLDSVTGADYITNIESQSIYATAKDSESNVEIKLKVIPEETTLPGGTISWSGGNAGTDQLTRVVPKDTLAKSGIVIQANSSQGNVVNQKVYIYKGKNDVSSEMDYQVNIKRDDSITNNKGVFGVLDRSNAYTPQIECDIYYENKEWRFTFDKIEYTLTWGVNSLGRKNITTGTENPFPKGMGMSDASSQTERKSQAKGDLKPLSNGSARRDKYWSESISIQHELYHAADWIMNYHYKEIEEFDKIIRDELKLPVTKDTLDPDVVLGAIMGEDGLDFESQMNTRATMASAEYEPESEDRADEDGRQSYQDLHDAIQLE